MKHKNILKRAWSLLWDYKAIWIFGIILAMTSASYSAQSSYRFNGRDNDRRSEEINFNSGEDFAEWFENNLSEAKIEFNRLQSGQNLTVDEQKAVNIVIAVLCVIAVLIPVAKVLNYVSETALIKMVDDYEEHNKKLSIKEGFSLGWSKEAWKLFLVDLLIFFPLFFLTVGGLALSIWPLLAGFVENDARNVIAMVSSIGLFFLVILLSAMLGTLIRLLKHFIRRKLVLEQVGVFDAIREGSNFVWKNFKDVGLMWLIIVGINIAWPILLIPIGALLVAFGAVGGGLTALLTYALSSGSITAVSVIGGSIFFLILSLPLIFVGGLKASFLSSTWTLSYRELKAMESLTLKQVDSSEEIAE